MKALDGTFKIQSAIAKNPWIRTNHISKVLSQFKTNEIVEFITPEVRKGRLYMLTEAGVDVVKNLK